MTVDALMHKGLNNTDWAIVLFVSIEGRTTQRDLDTILSVASWEIQESLDKLEDMRAVRVDENGFIYSLVSN